jgi:hypothetical protein
MTRVTIRTVSALISGTAVAWLTAGAFAPAAAQSAAPPSAAEKKPGPAPKMADGHPDLSGVWWGGGDVGGRGFRPGGGPPAPGSTPPATFTSLYKPQAAEHAKTLSDKDDPTLHCNPVAFGTLNVRLWNVGAVGQIVATPKLVVLLSETFHDYQIVPTDGRKHRDDQPPTLRGDAVGHWEGRVSFHSDALHIVERYRRVDANTLEIEATVEDPKVLSGPWTVPKQSLKLAPFDTLLSLNCATDETDAQIQSASQPKK